MRMLLGTPLRPIQKDADRNSVQNGCQGTSTALTWTQLINKIQIPNLDAGLSRFVMQKLLEAIPGPISKDVERNCEQTGSWNTYTALISSW